MRVFDHLGTVLHFAKHDMVMKNDSLKAVAGRLPVLQQVGMQSEAHMRQLARTHKEHESTCNSSGLMLAHVLSCCQVVEEDRRAGRATVKDSCARNLHRLLCVITFMRVLLENLARSTSVTTYDAASAAYQQVSTLGHSRWVSLLHDVQHKPCAGNASMYTRRH